MDGKTGYVSRFVAAIRKRKPRGSGHEDESGNEDLEGVGRGRRSPEWTEGPASFMAQTVLDKLSSPTPTCSSGASGSTFGSFSGSSDITMLSSDTDAGSVTSLDPKIQVMSLVDELTQAVLERRPDQDRLYAFLADYLEDKLERRSRAERHRHSARSYRLEVKERQRHLANQSPDFSQVRKGTLVGSQEFASLREDVQVSAYNVYSDTRRGVHFKPEFSLPSGDPCRTTLSGHMGPVTSVHIISGHVITSSNDKTVRFWEVRTGREVKKITCHRPVNTLTTLRMDNRKYMLFAGCSMGEVEVLKLKFGNSLHVKPLAKYSFHVPNAVTTLKVSPDRLHLVSACCYPMYTIDSRVLRTSARGNLKVWRVEEVVSLALSHGSDCSPSYRVMSTARQLISTATGIKRISGGLYCGTGGKVNDFGVSDVDFTPDSAMMVVGFGFPVDSAQQFTKLVIVCCADTLTPAYLHQIMACPIRALSCFTLSPMRSVYQDIDDVSFGLMVMTSRNLSRYRLGRKQRGDLQAKLDLEWQSRPECVQHGAAISPDQSLMASVHDPTTGESPKLTFYDASTGEIVASYDTGHKRDVTNVCYSATGGMLCTGSLDGTVKLWSCPSEQLAHADQVVKSKLSDDCLLVDADDDVAEKLKLVAEESRGIGNLLRVYNDVKGGDQRLPTSLGLPPTTLPSPQPMVPLDVNALRAASAVSVRSQSAAYPTYNMNLY